MGASMLCPLNCTSPFLKKAIWTEKRSIWPTLNFCFCSFVEGIFEVEGLNSGGICFSGALFTIAPKESRLTRNLSKKSENPQKHPDLLLIAHNLPIAVDATAHGAAKGRERLYPAG